LKENKNRRGKGNDRQLFGKMKIRFFGGKYLRQRRRGRLWEFVVSEFLSDGDKTLFDFDEIRQIISAHENRTIVKRDEDTRAFFKNGDGTAGRQMGQIRFE